MDVCIDQYEALKKEVGESFSGEDQINLSNLKIWRSDLEKLDAGETTGLYKTASDYGPPARFRYPEPEDRIALYAEFEQSQKAPTSIEKAEPLSLWAQAIAALRRLVLSDKPPDDQ